MIRNLSCFFLFLTRKAFNFLLRMYDFKKDVVIHRENKMSEIEMILLECSPETVTEEEFEQFEAQAYEIEGCS